ncbi:hypothetical protein MNEG_8485 [Monoraphidium neglectum]|uniref:Mediator of RNA polymerase II transcription subunit 20 n=1 Tax=Monoraphidium neglectum TaxID=145388 RepID=A0A0D2M7Z9_9CHLO|nr:hypothetical protein MNEG_8485 [Monoraphidium neglectum]KIY99474.1 hypothetical protein MNEG_8485 [Monoraphidium neglectum]|eukprot:XP_013898494.1 hypothetical protein MNEG_8485 [Monoraphidium neglectum]
MGAKCLLLYHPPHGGTPTTADAERVVAALQRVCAVHHSRQPERQLEARCSQLSQAPARDMTTVTHPRSLADLWLLQLPRDAPDRVFLCNLKARQVVEADASIATALLDKRLEYRTKANLLLASRTWQLGDRRGSDASVKLLQLQVHGQAPLAIALEVAYHPLGSCSVAEPVLRELAGTLMSALEGTPDAGRRVVRLEVLPPPWDDYAAWLPPEASATHSAALYASMVVAVLRERSQSAIAARKAAGQ